MKAREHIAYQGTFFTIEWYYTSTGNSPALDYYQKLPDSQRRKLLFLFKRMGDCGKISDKTKFNNEGDQLYAFKPQPDRFLCFFMKDRKIIITNGFCKKTPKLPLEEKAKALRYKQNFYERLVQENYYE